MAEKTDQEKKEELRDYEGGYGGGRQRVEQMHDHAFGERGWTTRGGDAPETGTKAEAEQPEGVKETHGPDWQEKFVEENADKYGQGGGQPIEQTGGPQTTGGVPSEEGLGDTRDVSPRGAYGIRETENWPKTDTDDDRTDEVASPKKRG